jgi:hypothetical protein
MSQSQDISIFDKPSINELSSYSATPNNFSQKNITTFVEIDEFIPTNYNMLKSDFQNMSIENKKLILQGFSWRLIRSKSKWLRR